MSKSRLDQHGILAIVLAYAVVAGLWILFSDMAVESMFSDPAQLVRVSMMKGWLFVAVTTLLLYFLVRRLVRRLHQAQADKVGALSLLGDIADSADEAIFAKDAEGRYLLFNRAAGEFVGKPADQVIGHDDRAIFPAPQAEVLMAIGRRIMASGATESNEESLDTAKGTRVFHATKGPLRDDAGRTVGVFGISRDITESKRIERALRDREHSLSAIVNNSPAVLSLKHPDGRYTLANPNMQRLLGRDEAQIVGMTDFDFFPAEIARLLQANDAHVLNTRARHVVEEIVPVDGQPRVFMSNIFPILADDGSVSEICRITFDITERKRADEALHNLADDLAATLQAIPDMMFELDESGRYVSVKATHESLLAAPADQLVGHSVQEILPPDAVRTIMAALGRARQHGTDYGRTIALQLAGGERWFELSVSRKPGKPGEPQHYIVMSRDVTERREAEEALRHQAAELITRNEELERFTRAAVGREMDMIGLKRQINALSRELGRDEPFSMLRLDVAQAPTQEQAE